MTALVYHAGALGDFITAIPALEYWKKRGEGNELTLLGNPSAGELVKDAGLINNFLDVNCSRYAQLFSEDFLPEIGKILSPFQSAVLFAAPDSPLINNIKRYGIKTVYWQPPFPLSCIHAIDYHLSLFTDPASVPEHKKVPAVTPSGPAIASVNNTLPPALFPVALHPGSGSKMNYRGLKPAVS